MAEKTKIAIKHNLVPKQEVCTPEETAEILSKFNIKIDQLPMISKKDPSLVELGVEEGTVIRIHRSSETEPSSLFYRVVI